MITSGTGGTVNGSTSYTNYCAHRLPCGICRMTNQICPIWNGCGVYPITTWTTEGVTYDTRHEEADT